MRPLAPSTPTLIIVLPASPRGDDPPSIPRRGASSASGVSGCARPSPPPAAVKQAETACNLWPASRVLVFGGRVPDTDQARDSFGDFIAEALPGGSDAWLSRAPR